MMDVQHGHAVVAQMLRAQRATVLKGEYSPAQLLDLTRHFGFVVGMRLHFLIFASLQNVPFVALPYAPKVGGFLEDLKLDMPPWQLVNAGRLIAYIDHAWDRRKQLQTRMIEIKLVLHKHGRNARERSQLLQRGRVEIGHTERANFARRDQRLELAPRLVPTLDGRVVRAAGAV